MEQDTKPKNNKQSAHYVLTVAGKQYVTTQEQADKWNDWVNKKQSEIK